MTLSVRGLVDLVAADFAARGIGVPVLFGTWENHKARSDTRVIMGVGDWEFRPPGPPNAPGYAYDAGPERIGRAMDSDYQIALVWCYAAPNPNPKTPSRTELAEDAAKALSHTTWRAIGRAAQGSVAFIPGSGKWVDEGRLQGVVYGALRTWEFHIMSPVLDDPLIIPVLDPNIESGSSLELTVPG